MNKYLLSIGTVAIAAATWLLASGAANNEAPVARVAQEKSPLPAARIAAIRTVTPSAVGTALPAAEPWATRRHKMESRHYGTPPEYYGMSLVALNELAKHGDVFALLQLGEQYASESMELRRQPGFDTSEEAKTLAKRYFTDALAHGHLGAASVLSRMALEENNPVDAYAWNLLSTRLQDQAGAEWFRKSPAFANLSEQQKQLAAEKVPKLYEIASKGFIIQH
jgi:hypothetical protein